MEKSKDLFHAQRRQYWEKLVGEWKCSQLSQAEFCRQQKISHSSFSGWYTRLLRKETQASMPKISSLPPTLFPVLVAKEDSVDTSTKLTLQITNTLFLQFDEHVNKKALAVLLEVLGVRPC